MCICNIKIQLETVFFKLFSSSSSLCSCNIVTVCEHEFMEHLMRTADERLIDERTSLISAS